MKWWESLVLIAETKCVYRIYSGNYLEKIFRNTLIVKKTGDGRTNIEKMEI